MAKKKQKLCKYCGRVDNGAKKCRNHPEPDGKSYAELDGKSAKKADKDEGGDE